MHAGALQRRHERGSRPTAGAQATLERQLVADELINRKSDAWPHRSPLDCISLRKRSVELKGNATVWGMSAKCVVCKTARLFFGRFALSRTRPATQIWWTWLAGRAAGFPSFRSLTECSPVSRKLELVVRRAYRCFRRGRPRIFRTSAAAIAQRSCPVLLIELSDPR